MKYTISDAYFRYKNDIIHLIHTFSTNGKVFMKGSRNEIKNFILNDTEISIKKFKSPHIINKIIYRFLRKSKAQRSFEYAKILLTKGIGTPNPIAYAENRDAIGLCDSYYACDYINAPYTYRDLVENESLENREKILRKFTKFCFDIHEEGIEFLDHSPGNTLIDLADNEYRFYLVDLNRMQFHAKMNFEQRMKNLSRLTPKQDMVAIMANEYAKFYTEKSEGEIFKTLWHYTTTFQQKFFRKRRLKAKLKFWK